MFALVSIILILLAVVLIIVILIQPGKGEMLTGVGGISGQFNSVLGTKKATDLLKNITIYTAVAIAVVCLAYNLTNDRTVEATNQNLPSTLDTEEMMPASPATPDIVPEQPAAEQSSGTTTESPEQPAE